MGFPIIRKVSVIKQTKEILKLNLIINFFHKKILN